MNSTYKTLSIATVIFKVLAGAAILLGLLSGIAIFAGAGPVDTPRWMGIVTLVAGTVYAFMFTVASGAIRLLLDIYSKIK